jgi:hypothetical protein
VIQILDVAQGSPEWFAARAGIPTASEFSTVMAKGKDGGASVTRAKYMRQLAGEILTGEPAPEGYSNAFMARGHELEDEARSLYAFMRDAEPQRVGFIRNGQKGASPDSLLGDRAGLEIKVAIPAVQIERLQRGTLPTEHVAQVQGSMLVSERDTWDFVSYCPKLPPLILTVHRDEAYIANLAKAIDAFNEELEALVQSIRTYSDFNSQARAA